MKKGRHRRYEEARALKRSSADDNIEGLMDRLDDDPFAYLNISSSETTDEDDGEYTDYYDDDFDS